MSLLSLKKDDLNLLVTQLFNKLYQKHYLLSIFSYLCDGERRNFVDFGLKPYTFLKSNIL